MKFAIILILLMLVPKISESPKVDKRMEALIESKKEIDEIPKLKYFKHSNIGEKKKIIYYIEDTSKREKVLEYAVLAEHEFNIPIKETDNKKIADIIIK